MSSKYLVVVSEVPPVQLQMDLFAALRLGGQLQPVPELGCREPPDALLSQNPPSPGLAPALPPERSGRLQPGVKHAVLVHPVSVVEHTDTAGLRHDRPRRVDVTRDTDHHAGRVGVVGVLDQFNQRHPLATDEFSTQRVHQASTWPEPQSLARLARHRGQLVAAVGAAESTLGREAHTAATGQLRQSGARGLQTTVPRA